jgi:hypothetical protein
MKNDIRKPSISSTAPTIILTTSFSNLTIKPALHIMALADFDHGRLLRVA